MIKLTTTALAALLVAGCQPRAGYAEQRQVEQNAIAAWQQSHLVRTCVNGVNVVRTNEGRLLVWFYGHSAPSYVDAAVTDPAAVCQ